MDLVGVAAEGGMVAGRLDAEVGGEGNKKELSLATFFNAFNRISKCGKMLGV